MITYPKIQTVFLRDPNTKFKTLLNEEWALPEFEYLADCDWIGTEKIDGTNIRVHWSSINPSSVVIRGRTDKANIPPFLMTTLVNLLPPEKFQDIWSDSDHLDVTLFGEGYGNKIQKIGTAYIPDKTDFILFDVYINGIWLHRESVGEIANLMGIKRVPTVFEGNLLDAILLTKAGFRSIISSEDLTAEGLVLTPLIPLNNRLGKRIITKVKHGDF